ncbi:hypothetical protein M426DRAFT_323097 [Hypoxylon sp. CI-4A]|nr:hypothetical protein M426DRAFT_323097 [Hypoxylon sp. CI-4A]
MSTFNGIIHEFPDIRVDFFRRLAQQPPLACFLSHIHSDHLAGLDTFKGPFVYCSAATREILLRLEKYPCRLNYAKGIFEDPHMQTYKHLSKLLKPIPPDTPTEVEVGHQSIQVTLLDANHCAGAVMFLFEAGGKAVLYTGDIRSEPWWVNSIARSPSMIEYSTGLKILDRIYLDTSILDDFPLQTKSEGLRELLEKVAQYPKDTIFHLQAWTYGYEEVWIALSKALGSKIHVDEYKMRVYKSLATKSSDHRFAAQTHLTKEAPYLVGFTCGNNQREGCLTLDESVRIHSCEKGMGCKVVEEKPIVWIQPIVAHLSNGRDMVEVGIGGGGDDLSLKPTLEAEDIRVLLEIQNEQIISNFGPEVKDILQKALVASRDVAIDMETSDSSDDRSMAELFASLVTKMNSIRNPVKQLGNPNDSGELPNQIVFPYARHSSLPELRHLVETFKPKDIWPCTVDPPFWVERGISIRRLFGDICSGDEFAHDAWIGQLPEMALRAQREVTENATDAEPATSPPRIHSSPFIQSSDIAGLSNSITKENTPGRAISLVPTQPPGDVKPGQPASPQATLEVRSPRKRSYDSFINDQTNDVASVTEDDEDEINLQDSQASTLSAYAYDTRLRAFQAMQANLEDNGTWNTISLISTTDNHSTIEPELGNT